MIFYTEILAAITATTALAISMITLSSMLLKGYKTLINLPNDIRNYFFKPKYLIMPTPDEIVKYSIRQEDRYTISVNEIMEEQEYSNSIILRKATVRSNNRLKMVALSFGILYFIFFVRLIYYGYLGSLI